MIRCLKNFYHLLVSLAANIIYGFPSRKLTVIGVTGTDGKTTTSTLIYSILKEAGNKSALISTVSAKIGEKEVDTGLHTTTPDPFELQKLIHLAVKRDVKYLVLESTSHGLDQHRLFGVKFYAGVITNVTHEHLDYHKTYENYLKAKAKLFDNVKIAVLNRDDRSYKFLNSKLARLPALERSDSGQATRNSQPITYGIENKADFTPKTFNFKTPLPGKYNLYNCLAAIALASSLGIPPEIIRKVVLSFKGVIGRMEKIKEGQDFEVIVDFAHTPNGLENTLATIKEQKNSRSKTIVVFGCAGLRDRTKRPMMGEIATRLASVAVLTAEDPRTENINDIIDQIAKGCKKAGGVEGKSFFRIPDRREAIRFAIQRLAKKADIVIICGKGHEKSMCFGKIEYPWSDQQEAKKALKERI